MATTATLIQEDRLVRFELPPDCLGQPERLLFMAPEFVDWLDDVLWKEKKDRSRDLTPYEQVENMFTQFVSNPGFTGVGDFISIKPQAQGVYEMKTTDVRVFGWFYRPQQFIAVTGEMKKRLKGRRDLVAGYRKMVEGFRTKLDLDPPPFVRGNCHELV